MATGYQNARCYWEMYEGVNPEGTNQHVTALDISMDIGGYAAEDYPYYQVSIYGREYIDGANLETIYQETIDQTTTWRRVNISVEPTDPDVRCIVVKVEALYEDIEPPDPPAGRSYDDQYASADPPAWGIRIRSAHIYGSELVRNVRPDLVLEDILDNAGFTYSGPEASWTADQLQFTQIPYDRRDALDDINGMLGWNYACWDGTAVEFALPESGTAWEIGADDARTSWSITESLDETYNAVRVCYGNKKGKLREVIVHGDESAIGITRADTLQAPDSIKSELAATRFGERYLAAHEKRQVVGRVTISGDDGVTDPLLIRPGDTITMTGPARTLRGTHEVSHVTLRPLEWTADVQFGNNSKRFDTWLARLAAGAKSIKRR